MTTPGDNPPPSEPTGEPGPGGYSAPQPNTGGYSAPQQGAGGYAAPQQQSNTPMVLGIIGIVCWFFCGIGAIASIILGALGQSKARQYGQSDTLPRVAWIGGICFLVLWSIAAIYGRSH